jgi:hypothetical protein
MTYTSPVYKDSAAIKDADRRAYLEHRLSLLTDDERYYVIDAADALVAHCKATNSNIQISRWGALDVVCALGSMMNERGVR